MALPHGTTGSLRPAFAPARPMCLAVKHPYTFPPCIRLPTALRVPFNSSVPLLEEPAPVKLPAYPFPHAGSRSQVRIQVRQEWYFTGDYSEAGAPDINVSHLCYAWRT